MIALLPKHNNIWSSSFSCRRLISASSKWKVFGSIVQWRPLPPLGFDQSPAERANRQHLIPNCTIIFIFTLVFIFMRMCVFVIMVIFMFMSNFMSVSVHIFMI
jgi:hypothetical protein